MMTAHWLVIHKYMLIKLHIGNSIALIFTAGLGRLIINTFICPSSLVFCFGFFLPPVWDDIKPNIEHYFLLTVTVQALTDTSAGRVGASQTVNKPKSVS